MIACYSHCVYLTPCNDCMLFTLYLIPWNDCMLFRLCVFNTLLWLHAIHIVSISHLVIIPCYSHCVYLTPCNDCMLFTVCMLHLVMIGHYSHCVYLTPCNDFIFQALFLHATDFFLYKCSVLHMYSVINFSS